MRSEDRICASVTEETNSVLNIFKMMVTDDGILEKSDMYILGPMKEFASNEDVVNIAATKQLLILIERSVRRRTSFYRSSADVYRSKKGARRLSRSRQSLSHHQLL